MHAVYATKPLQQAATKNLYPIALLTVKILILTLEHQHFPQKIHFLNIFIYKY